MEALEQLLKLKGDTATFDYFSFPNSGKGKKKSKKMQKKGHTTEGDEKYNPNDKNFLHNE